MSGHKFESIARAEVAIIGGGVIGLTIARALAKRGVTDVMVIEKNEFGREASWAAGGILAPQVEANSLDDFFKLACASRDMYPRFGAELKNETGVDVELDTTGTLCVALSQEDETELRRRFEWQQRERLSVEWLNGDDARRLEPCLSKRVRCGLLFPNDYQVENRKLLTALMGANANVGVKLIDHCAVERLRIESGSVSGIETSRGIIKAGSVVLAAGAWSSSIESTQPLSRIEIEPVRGQMLCFRPREQFARHVIYSSRGYLIPRQDGRLLAGSTSEHAGFDKRVTDEGIAAIGSMAFEVAPELEKCPIVDSWTGFRPRAKDGLPVIGPAPHTRNLFYATGHFRNGILLAPITGELIADTIVAGGPSENVSERALKSFSPDRFINYH